MFGNVGDPRFKDIDDETRKSLEAKADGEESGFDESGEEGQEGDEVGVAELRHYGENLLDCPPGHLNADRSGYNPLTGRFEQSDEFRTRIEVLAPSGTLSHVEEY